MALTPSDVPEMREFQVSSDFTARMEEIESILDTQIAALKRQWKTGMPAVHGTSMIYTGTALVLTLRLKRLSPAEQFETRQRYLKAGWDEVEFEPHEYESAWMCVTLIEHKWPAEPRKFVQDPYVGMDLGPI